jgi:fructose-bisphosphate aldolase class II
MPLVPTLEIVDAAAAKRFAVAAINIVDEVSARGVVAAAEEARSPVILQTSVKTVRAIGSGVLYTIVRHVADSVDVPVGLHLDHCPDRRVISGCLAAGWGSVLFDASDRPLAVATEETADVVREARAAGAAVEAELENISGVEDDLGATDEGTRHAVSVVARFVEETECDLFAPALGTAHGLYRTRPEIDVDRARQLRAALRVPLVLHGGTGLEASDFDALIDAGCAKINVSTSLKRAYMMAALEFLEGCRATDTWDPPSLFAAIRQGVKEDIQPYFSTFGSRGRA